MLSFLSCDRGTSIYSCVDEGAVERGNEGGREHVTGWQNREFNHHPTPCSCSRVLGEEAAGVGCELGNLLGRLDPSDGSYFGEN